tara:strand:- start:11277 stop:13985 length:2709 start_codon:yes stop_codon:yes gene_type:complete
MPELRIPDPSSLAVLEQFTAPVWIFDLDRHAIWWGNVAAQRFWNTTSVEELTKRDFSSDSETVRQRLRQLMLDPEASRRLRETWTLYPGEKPIAVTLRVQTVFIEDERAALLIEITSGQDFSRDIHTARIEEAVRYSGTILSMFSMSGSLLAQNAAAFECYGTPPGEGNHLSKRLADHNAVGAILKNVAGSGGYDAEIEVQTKSSVRTHRVKAAKGRDPATGSDVVVLSEDDISDLVGLRLALSELNATLEQRVTDRTEKLRVSEERFSLAMRGANDGLWDHNIESGEIYFSPRWLEMLGYGTDDIAPNLDTILSLVHPKDRGRVQALVIHPEPSVGNAPEAEFRIQHKDGHWVDILSRAFRVIRDGQVVRIVGSHIDISDRKRSERVLHRLKEILEEGSEALPLGVAYYDRNFRLVMNNERYCSMVSMPNDDLVPGLLFETMLRSSSAHTAHQLGYEDAEDYVADRMRLVHLGSQKWEYELACGRMVTATEIPTTGNGVISIIQDITEERARQKQLQQAQKMEAIGQLTGGVAHDFNNLLAVIVGNLELLQGQVETPKVDVEEARELIDAAIEAVDHGADLTSSMLAYARKAQLAPTVLDINLTVQETERWMRRTIKSNIEIKTELQEDVWPIRVDRSSLQSALVNLIVNARDAMETGGTLTIKTANMLFDKSSQKLASETPLEGRYVVVCVADNGCGIAPEILEGIYEPFFTTKSVGRGTGLGLSMVEGFVRQSGGAIRVHSKPGEGTSFKLFFAAQPEDTLVKQPLQAPSLPSAKLQSAHARVLLAEDKDDVRLVLKKTLVAAGYDVTTARSGDIGYTIFEADPSFDLVVTDIVMPGVLQGVEFANKCRELRPLTPFIFLSGYSPDVTGQEMSSDDIRLMKPVSRSKLLETVERCLKNR